MDPIWRPSPLRVRNSNLTRFVTALRASGDFASGDQGAPVSYGVLHEWSIRNPEKFWRAVASFCAVIADDFAESKCFGLDRMAPPDEVLGPRWFDGTTLNFAENLLRYRDDRPAIIAWNESGRQEQLSFAELGGEVSRIASALRDMGVGVGDRVAGYMPNIPETIIAMLATTTLGAVWSSCSPDFGVQGVVDRFGQIEPKVLICADGYRYAGKTIDCIGRAAEICGRIPSIAHVILVPYMGERADPARIPHGVRWDSLRRVGDAPPFERLPFDHPVYVMYSSGTTGLPKCMVHGAGGTLLQHLKELVIHTDMVRDDRMFYFTTCGWMMWNWMLSSLAVGATVVLYDGAPLQPRREILWDMIVAERVTVFGTSAKYLALSEKGGVAPAATHDVSALRAILSTGSPLAAHSYDYVYTQVKSDVHLASISGGTDIISCFALGNPAAPVYAGELQCRGLGMAVEVFDASGVTTVQQPGELVCTRPFPSMPVRFWADPDGTRYRAAYFDVYPDVWRHGDWAELTEHDGVIIYGRSDATLNPGGVRIGTAEIYRQVDQLPEVLESVAIGQELGDGAHGDVRIVLFVRLRDGVELSDELVERIRTRIRSNTTPLHVPKAVLAVSDIPRTVSGKISEIAVREVVHGRAVTNVEALANPAALELFRDLPALASSPRSG
ncbi:MAG: acetoacetate--CoA ligase [Gemmatimonadota bacterium]|nr:acetoacetate--CoA ligase [Gemmatimonadota bacterium]